MAGKSINSETAIGFLFSGHKYLETFYSVRVSNDT